MWLIINGKKKCNGKLINFIWHKASKYYKYLLYNKTLYV